MKILQILLFLLAICHGAFLREPTFDKLSDFDRNLHRLTKGMHEKLDYVKYKCNPCPSGYGVESNCNNEHQTICKRCKSGTFAGPFSHYDTCKQCTVCDKGLYEKTECTEHKDTECESCTEFLPMINRDYIDKCLSRIDDSRDWPESKKTKDKQQNDPLKEQRLAFEEVLEKKINGDKNTDELGFAEDPKIDDQAQLDSWIAEREDDKFVMQIVGQDFQDANPDVTDKKISKSSSSSSSSEEENWKIWWEVESEKSKNDYESNLINSNQYNADLSERILSRARSLIQLFKATKILIFLLCIMSSLLLCMCVCRSHAKSVVPKTRVILSSQNFNRYNPLKNNKVPYNRLNEVEEKAIRNAAIAQTHKFVNSDDESDNEYEQPVHTVVNPLSQIEENEKVC